MDFNDPVEAHLSRFGSCKGSPFVPKILTSHPVKAHLTLGNRLETWNLSLSKTCKKTTALSREEACGSRYAFHVLAAFWESRGQTGDEVNTPCAVNAPEAMRCPRVSPSQRRRRPEAISREDVPGPVKVPPETVLDTSLPMGCMGCMVILLSRGAVVSLPCAIAIPP